MIGKNVFKTSVLILSAMFANEIHSECIDGKVKFVDHGKEVIRPESYCYDSDLKMLLSTKPCAKGSVCQNKNLGTIELKISEIASETGSLGFKICEKFHGTPQIIEYWGKNVWHSSSRCLFSDGSFIDTASLSQKVKYLD